MMLVLGVSLRTGEGCEPDIGGKGTDGLRCIIGEAGNMRAEGEITSTAEVGELIEELWLEVNAVRGVCILVRERSW